MKGPIRQIPTDMFDAFTMNRQIHVVDQYFDNEYEHAIQTIFTKEKVHEVICALRENRFTHYENQAQFIIPILQQNVLQRDVLVVGSISPVLEAVCIFLGAKSVSTLEYSEIKCEDDRIKTYTYETIPIEQFDTIISYSSFEHSGLGRYGDELDPNGDLKAMEFMKTLLKEDGVLIVAVPIGEDMLFWNGYRQYGPIRWPLFTNGWDLLKVYPEVNEFRCSILQPIWVFRKEFS